MRLDKAIALLCTASFLYSCGHSPDLPDEPNVCTPQPIPPGPIQNGQIIPNQYIIVFEDGLPYEQVKALAHEKIDLYGGKIRTIYEVTIPGFSAELDQTQCNRFLRDLDVRQVMPNRYLTLEQ